MPNENKKWNEHSVFGTDSQIVKKVVSYKGQMEFDVLTLKRIKKLLVETEDMFNKDEHDGYNR